MLFAGTAQPGMPGYIRAYPIGQGNAAGPGPGPGSGGGAGGGVAVAGGGAELKGEFQEHGCLSLPVSCMALNHDGSLLFVGGEDGVLAMYCVAEDAKAAEKKVSYSTVADNSGAGRGGGKRGLLRITYHNFLGGGGRIEVDKGLGFSVLLKKQIVTTVSVRRSHLKRVSSRILRVCIEHSSGGARGGRGGG